LLADFYIEAYLITFTLTPT